MKNLILYGDPGIRKGAIIEHEGQEYVCFGISRQGEWHGPEEVQLWCTIGTADEQEDFERRNYIPMRLDTEAVDAEEITVKQAKGDPATV
ncbi:MAG: HAH_0734 family protein [Halobacteriota archaeon]|uniref:HAH_0734 family protein n=1 Tax=Natronomonas sp. TaxID=2184060 RepID=UPI0039761CD0